MSMTKVMIISNALNLLGKSSITSLDNVSPLVNQAEAAFDMKYASQFSKSFWRFATKIVQLSQLTTPPVVDYWQYNYQLPSDWVKIVHQYPPNYGYEIYENNQMYSNLIGPLWLEYQFVPEVTDCPIYFCEYMAYEVALYLSLSNAQLAQFYQVLKPDRDIMLAQAQAADSQNRPQTALQSMPAICTRFVAQFVSG